jgi:lipopolysaccharide transport system ATP-binding protein
MSASVRVIDVSKSFVLAKHGGHSSMLEALRAGKPNVVQREVRALQDVSFSLQSGERIGVIGRNGAGKTTLLSLLAGIAQPTSGIIEISGKVHAMLTIGAVLREEATGRENILLDATVYGLSQEEIEARTPTIVDFAELGEFIDKPVRTYSSGMKGRLAFAMGAFTSSDILIVDETLSVGDATFSRKATARMKQLTREGQIVIVVSHSLSSIVDICDRCLWLENGRIVMDGAPLDVTRAYASAVDRADEAELKQKFQRVASGASRPDSGMIESVGIRQEGSAMDASVRARVPTEIVVRGHLARPEGEADLELSLLRVDGRHIWRDRLSAHDARLQPAAPFSVTVRMDPMVLGSNLFRLDATLRDAKGVSAALSRVFEVVDDDPPIGGRPMLYAWPEVVIGDAEEGN